MDASTPIRKNCSPSSLERVTELPSPLLLPPSMVDRRNGSQKPASILNVASSSSLDKQAPHQSRIHLSITPLCSSSCSSSPERARSATAPSPSYSICSSEKATSPREPQKRRRFGLSPNLRHTVVLSLDSLSSSAQGSGDVRLLRRIHHARAVHRVRKPSRVARQLVLLSRDVRRNTLSVLERLLHLAQEGDGMDLTSCECLDDITGNCTSTREKERTLLLAVVCSDAGDWGGIRNLPKGVLSNVMIMLDRDIGKAEEEEERKPWMLEVDNDKRDQKLMKKIEHLDSAGQKKMKEDNEKVKRHNHRLSLTNNSLDENDGGTDKDARSSSKVSATLTIKSVSSETSVKSVQSISEVINSLNASSNGIPYWDRQTKKVESNDGEMAKKDDSKTPFPLKPEWDHSRYIEQILSQQRERVRENNQNDFVRWQKHIQRQRGEERSQYRRHIRSFVSILYDCVDTLQQQLDSLQLHLFRTSVSDVSENGDGTSISQGKF